MVLRQGKGVARMFDRGSTICSEATDSATCFASEKTRSAPDRVTAVVMGATPYGAKPPVGVRGLSPR